VIDSQLTRQVQEGCADPLAHEIMVADALGALDRLIELESFDPARNAVNGCVRGGDVALDIVSSAQIMPATGGIRAVVAFYPTCKEAGPVRRPAILVLPDLYPAAGLCRAYAEAQAGAGEAPVRYVTPGEVQAGFDCEICPGGYLGGEDVFDRASTEMVRQLLIEELEGFFAPAAAP
jgi:dienelactone hydrolase